jgi:hypothetical protein
MTDMTVSSELARILGFAEMTQQELIRADYECALPGKLIREQVALRCKAWKLTEQQADECMEVAIARYNHYACSIARAISFGVAKARTLAPVGAL